MGSGLQPLRIRASRRFPSPDSALSNSAIAEALFQLNEVIPSSLSRFFKVCAFLNELSSHINTNKFVGPATPHLCQRFGELLPDV